MIHLVQSASAAERLAAARSFIDGFSSTTELLIVGASREAADDLARQITISRGALFGVHRLSLLQLASKLAALEMSKSGVAPTTMLGTTAMAARITFEAQQVRALDYFDPVSRFPGFAAALAKTVIELRSARVPPTRIAVLDGAGSDVADLLRRFEEQLQRVGIADRVELLRVATSAASQATDSLLQAPLVLLDVPIWSTVEREFVAAITAKSSSVLITVPRGDDMTRGAIESIATSHGTTVAPVEASSSENGESGSDLGRLRDHLFTEMAPPESPGRGEVIFFSAPGEGREAIEIARLILDEARKGTAFDRIAVLLRTPMAYAMLLETALERAGIPAFFSQGTRRPDAAGRAFLALLDCAREGLSARRFAEYLSLGQVPALGIDGRPPTGRSFWIAPEDEAVDFAARFINEETEVPEASEATDSDLTPEVAGALRAPWKWEELIVEASVIGGKDRWSRRLDGLVAEYRLRLQLLNQEEEGSARAQSIERELANLQHLRQFSLPVIERLAVLPAGGLWGDWLVALEQLAPMVLRHPERVLAVLGDLRTLAPVGPVSMDEVRNVLAEPLASSAQRPSTTRFGRVFVGSLEQARGRAFEIVFLPGLAERVFPQRPQEDPILLDELRRQLGEDLRTQGDRSHHERLLLRLGVGAAGRRLYLSYPRFDSAGARARVASFYALEVQRALSGHIPDPQALEREASAVAGARLAWPAPEDPKRAIDDTERDLAVLRGLLEAPREGTRGRARYLFALSDCLARSLRTRWARWMLPRWMPQDGIVRLADGSRELLSASRLDARAYSVGALQKFATCPYQFYLSEICRLAPREEVAPLERLDPLTRGKLFHQVQAEALRALHHAGRTPLSRETIRDAMLTVDGALDRVAAAYWEELAPPIRRVWQDEIETLRVDLRVWIERCVEIQALWEPIAFELAFGLRMVGDFDPQSVVAEVLVGDRFRIRGVIDLVERKSGSSELRVTDYKTGRNWTNAGVVVGGGETLQPTLYGLAVEQILGGTALQGRLFYCTRDGEFSDRIVTLSESTRRRSVEVLEIIDRAVGRGFLPPAPRRKACVHCDFREVCGPHEEIRFHVKDADPLADLTALRSWP